MIVYDKAFNLNEWFVIVMLAVTYTICFLLPRRFPLSMTILLFAFCIVFGMTIDHTTSVPPYDNYDVNDNSNYNFMDMLTYFLYAPAGYFFLYAYDKLNIRGGFVLPYVVGGSLGAICFEWVTVQCQVFHYDKGIQHEIFNPFVFDRSEPVYFVLPSAEKGLPLTTKKALPPSTGLQSFRAHPYTLISPTEYRNMSTINTGAT